MGIYIFDTDVLLKALEADAVEAVEPRLRQDIIPTLINELPNASPLLRREQEGVEILARHRHARRVLRRTWIFAASIRSSTCTIRMADADLPAAGAAGEVRVRRESRRCGEALDSIISPGCIISGSQVVGSVLCPNVACTVTASSSSRC